MVMGTGVVVAAAVLLTESVNTLVVALVVLKDGVTPAGKPDALKATVPVNPFVGVTVMVLFPLPPCGTVAGDNAEAERLKSAAGVIT